MSNNTRTPEQEAIWQAYLRESLAEREDDVTRAGNAWQAAQDNPA